jgi:hypothetical protein
MRKMGLCVLWSCVLFLAVICDAADDGSKDILLLNSPGVDGSVAKQCFDFVERNVQGRIRVDRTLLSTEGFTPPELLKAFSAMRSKDDALVVVLVGSETELTSVVAYSEKLHSATVNITPMLNAAELTPKGRSARIDRAVMYAIGRLIGLSPCLNPYCALSEYEHTDKDRIPGRNFCPVCADAAGKALQALGVGEAAVIPKERK